MQTVALAAAVIDSGGEPRPCDVSATIPRRSSGLLDARPGRDLVVASGGVSVGRHDHVRDDRAPWNPRFLAHLGAARQAAGGGRAGRRDGDRPAREPGQRARHIRALCPTIHPRHARTAGRRSPPRARHADGADRERCARRAFLRVRVREHGGGFDAEPAGGQQSSQLRPMADANALLVVPEGPTPPSRAAPTTRSAPCRRATDEAEPSRRRRRAAHGRRRRQAGDRAPGGGCGHRAHAARGAGPARGRGRSEG